jgi:hypothetical protein
VVGARVVVSSNARLLAVRRRALIKQIRSTCLADSSDSRRNGAGRPPARIGQERTPASRRVHTLNVSLGSSSDRDVVIGHAIDGSIDAFWDFEEVDGCLFVSGVVEDDWTSFYRLDGEKLTPILGQYDWVERLIPTGSRDLPSLIQVLTEYARTHQFETDGSDPSAFVDELARREYRSRWPKWPSWLDRWMHGDRPDR